MPNYEIVDWIWDKLKKDKKDAFKNTRKLKSAAKELDTKGVMDGFLGQNKWADVVSTGKNSTGNTLRDRIKTYNQKYIKDFQVTIDNTDDVDSLDKLNKQIDTEFESETVDEIEQNINTKIKESDIIVDIGGEEFIIPAKFGRGRLREEVKDLVEGMAGEVLEQILIASSKEEIEAIEIPDNLTSGIKSFLNSSKKDAIRRYNRRMKRLRPKSI